MRVRSVLNSVVALLLLSLLVSCGFHLRGSANLPDSLKSLFVQGIDIRQGLGLELKRGLMRNGVTVLAQYKQGGAVLTVMDNHFERRVLSVGADAKVSEYELYGTMTYKVSNSYGVEVSPAQKIEARRDYQFDQNQILAADEEERLLRVQLDQQLVQTLLRRLSVLK